MKKINSVIMTISDSVFCGHRKDDGGFYLKELLEERGFSVIDKVLLPDNLRAIEESLIEYSNRKDINLIITIGGTGFSPQDVTPDATLEVVDEQINNIEEGIREHHISFFKRHLSRSVAGIRNKTLIVNFPSSRTSIKETIDRIEDTIIEDLEKYGKIVSFPEKLMIKKNISRFNEN